MCDPIAHTSVPALSRVRARITAVLDRLGDRVSNRLIRARLHTPIQVPTQEPIVSFTFDDVPDTALTAGAEILERYGAQGTFYIAGSLAGRIEPDRTLIDTAGCCELAARGHEIGCHTFTHTNLRRLNRAELAADLARSAHYLKTIDPGRERRNFAFPYNAGSLGKRQQLAAEFRTCRAGGEAINRGGTDAAFLRSVEIRQPEAHARALTQWIDALVARPGWLIFFTHDVAPTPTPYGCTPETLEALVAYARVRGCRILSIDAALDRMGLRGMEPRTTRLRKATR